MKKFEFGFIVEGIYDEQAVRRAIPGDYPIIVLHGNGLSKFMEAVIKRAMTEVENLFILTDEAGDIIAQKIQEKFGLRRIPVDKEECKCLRSSFGEKIWKYGVQFASNNYIQKIFNEAL